MQTRNTNKLAVMVQTRAQTRGQTTQPTDDSVRSSNIQDNSSVEYEFGPTYSIDFVHDVGADPDETFENDVASANDVASRMTQGSGGADDVGSVPPPPRGGNESHVLAPSCSNRSLRTLSYSWLT